MAIPGSWFYLIFFAGAVRLTGPFVTMIYSMLVGDMFRFSIIYMIFLFGFTQAFYFLFKHPPSERNTTKRFASYPITWMSLFHMTLGSYEYEEFRETYYQKLTQLVFAIFMVFTPILLLNMLIAMMGNTYCEVITQSEKEWVKQWANIIVALERAIDSKSAKEFVQTYSIKMPSTEKDVEVRGVIVIKTKLKSKAKEKKQALSLWKRVGKRTVQELRKVGGSAAEVRRRYNLFRSKQPTARLRMGKVIQEWNPTPPPLFPQTAVQTNVSADTSINNAGFNDLLTKVASATGMDIEKPVGQEESLKEEQVKRNTDQVYASKLTENQGNITTAITHNIPEKGTTTAQPDTPPKEPVMTQTIENMDTKMQNSGKLNIKSDQNWESRQTDLTVVFPENMPDIKSHTGLQPIKQSDDKSISVSIQTRIINTRITKMRTRRRKDAVFPKRNEYSDSTSEKETKKGLGHLKRESSITGPNFRGASKYRRRRKRNQISFQEKISVDNVPCDIPFMMEADSSKPNI